MLIYAIGIGVGVLLAALDSRSQPTPTPIPSFKREPYSDNTYPQPRMWTNQPAPGGSFDLAIRPGVRRCVLEYNKPLRCE